MSNESVEVQLARVDERLNMVLEELKASRVSRGAQYAAIEKLDRDLTQIGTRVENVENKLAKSEPTIEEFITIKHKVQGAGALGKWVWAAGGALIGLVAASREAIFHYFSKGS